MLSRRGARSYPSDCTQQLRDLFSIHKHKLDSEAAAKATLTKKKLRVVERTLSIRSNSMRTNSTLSRQDVEEASNDERESQKEKSKDSPSSRVLQKGHSNIFERSKSSLKELFSRENDDDNNNATPIKRSPSSSPITIINSSVASEDKKPRDAIQTSKSNTRTNTRTVDPHDTSKMMTMKLDATELSAEEREIFNKGQNTTYHSTSYSTYSGTMSENMLEEDTLSQPYSVLSTQNISPLSSPIRASNTINDSSSISQFSGSSGKIRKAARNRAMRKNVAAVDSTRSYKPPENPSLESSELSANSIFDPNQEAKEKADRADKSRDDKTHENKTIAIHMRSSIQSPPKQKVDDVHEGAMQRVAAPRYGEKIRVSNIYMVSTPVSSPVNITPDCDTNSDHPEEIESEAVLELPSKSNERQPNEECGPNRDQSPIALNTQPILVENETTQSQIEDSLGSPTQDTRIHYESGDDVCSALSSPSSKFSHDECFIPADVPGPSPDPGSLSKYNQHLTPKQCDETIENSSQKPRVFGAFSARAPILHCRPKCVKSNPKLEVARAAKETSKKKIQLLNKNFGKMQRFYEQRSKRGQTPMQRRLAKSMVQECSQQVEHLMQMFLKTSNENHQLNEHDIKFLAITMDEADSSMLNTTGKLGESEDAHGNDDASSSKVDPEEYEALHRSKILDLYNMKKGFLRCSYLNLSNAEDMPKFVYISKNEPNSLAERVSNGHGELTSWDRYVISLITSMDSYIESTLKDRELISMKEHMSAVQDLQPPCSRDQALRRLCKEFKVLQIESERCDVMHVFGEIYKVREATIRRAMNDAERILQQDIDSQLSKALPSRSRRASVNYLPNLEDSISSSNSQDMRSSQRRASRKKWVAKLSQLAPPGSAKSSASNSVLLHSDMSAQSADSGSITSLATSNASSARHMQDSKSMSSMHRPASSNFSISTGTLSSCKHGHKKAPRTYAAEFKIHKMPKPHKPGRFGQSSFVKSMPSDDSFPLTTSSLQKNRPRTSNSCISLFPEHSPGFNDSSIYYYNDSPYVPWIPPGGMKIMVSDKSNAFLNWQERKNIDFDVDNTKTKTVLKRCDVVRDSFENFAKTNIHLASS